MNFQSFLESDDLLTAQVNHKNTNPRLPCVLIVDSSGSMGQIPENGAELNSGLHRFTSFLRTDPFTSNRVEIAIIAAGGEEPTIKAKLQESRTVEDIQISPAGRTPIYQALKLALRMIQNRKDELTQLGIPSFRPWIIVMSDGLPTDQEHSEVLDELNSMQQRGKVEVYPFSVGDHSNLDFLSTLNINQSVFKLANAKYNELFTWLSSTLSVVSENGNNNLEDFEGQTEHIQKAGSGSNISSSTEQIHNPETERANVTETLLLPRHSQTLTTETQVIPARERRPVASTQRTKFLPNHDDETKILPDN